MKHIIDFEGARWFQLETLQDAEADEVYTKYQGAARFWSLTENGNSFYVLRDQQDLTVLTTCIFGRGTLESKPTDRIFKEDMSRALQALAEHLGVQDPRFLNHGEPRVDVSSDFEP